MSEGFCQITASTRAQRAATKDKAGKEKELLKKRPGNQLVYDTPITEPDPNSISYATSNERFEQDYAGHEKVRRPFVHFIVTPIAETSRAGEHGRPLAAPPFAPMHSRARAWPLPPPRKRAVHQPGHPRAPRWRPPPFS